MPSLFVLAKNNTFARCAATSSFGIMLLAINASKEEIHRDPWLVEFIQIDDHDMSVPPAIENAGS